MTRLFAMVVVALSFAHLAQSSSPGGVVDVQADLVKAVEQRDLAGVKSALDKGARAGAAGAFHRTPLHTAAKESSAEIIELLLARGADVNAHDDEGRTPLHLANSMSAELLLRHKADVSARDKTGNTAMHIAAEQDGPAMCQRLVSAGAEVNVKNSVGLTPLHFAALQGQQRVAEYLLAQHVDLNAQTQAPYSWKWSYIGWDVLGMEVPVPKGATAISIARSRHKQNKWSSGRFGVLADYLKSKGAIEKSGWWPF